MTLLQKTEPARNYKTEEKQKGKNKNTHNTNVSLLVILQRLIRNCKNITPLFRFSTCHGSKDGSRMRCTSLGRSIILYGAIDVRHSECELPEPIPTLKMDDYNLKGQLQKKSRPEDRSAQKTKKVDYFRISLNSSLHLKMTNFSNPSR